MKERVSIDEYVWSCPKCGYDNITEASNTVTCFDCGIEFKAD